MGFFFLLNTSLCNKLCLLLLFLHDFVKRIPCLTYVNQFLLFILASAESTCIQEVISDKKLYKEILSGSPFLIISKADVRISQSIHDAGSHAVFPKM